MTELEKILEGKEPEQLYFRLVWRYDGDIFQGGEDIIYDTKAYEKYMESETITIAEWESGHTGGGCWINSLEVSKTALWLRRKWSWSEGYNCRHKELWVLDE